MIRGRPRKFASTHTLTRILSVYVSLSDVRVSVPAYLRVAALENFKRIADKHSWKEKTSGEGASSEWGALSASYASIGGGVMSSYG